MKRKSFMLIPSMLLALTLGMVGCSSDEDSIAIDGRYAAMVKNIPTDGDIIEAIITEAPNGLSSDKPIKGNLVFFPKNDLHIPDLKICDTIAFKIINYKKLPTPENVTWDKTYDSFICRVKPYK